MRGETELGGKAGLSAVKRIFGAGSLGSFGNGSQYLGTVVRILPVFGLLAAVVMVWPSGDGAHVEAVRTENTLPDPTESIAPAPATAPESTVASVLTAQIDTTIAGAETPEASTVEDSTTTTTVADTSSTAVSTTAEETTTTTRPAPNALANRNDPARLRTSTTTPTTTRAPATTVSRAGTETTATTSRVTTRRTVSTRATTTTQRVTTRPTRATTTTARSTTRPTTATTRPTTRPTTATTRRTTTTTRPTTRPTTATTRRTTTTTRPTTRPTTATTRPTTTTTRATTTTTRPTTTTTRATTTTTRATTTTTRSGGTCASNGRFERTFRDDFNGSSLNSAWTVFHNRPGNKGFGKRDRSAVSVENGKLVITAKMVNGNLVSSGIALPRYQTYGKYVFKIRTDNDPSEALSGVALTWPKSDDNTLDGENNIYETLANAEKRNPFYSFIHKPNAPATQQKRFVHNADGAQFQTMTMEWTPDRIMVRREGPGGANYSDTNILNEDSNNRIPDNPHRLSFQLDAYANSMTGTVQLEVDWVEVYKYCG